MKTSVKTILQWSIAVLAAVVTTAGVSEAVRRSEALKCRELEIRIQDKEKRYFVTEQEIANLLTRNGLHPAGKLLEEVNTQQIETVVRQHEMVRTAECYETQRGDVRIEMTQRVPLLRVTTPTESYFIDTDRRRMPVRASVDSKVMSVTGHVGQRQAQEEIADFVEWLQDNSYWSERVWQVEVGEGKQLVLRQRDNEPRILLGELNGYKQKLKRMRIFTEQEKKGAEVPTYKEIDLRYKGQVIGRYKQ